MLKFCVVCVLIIRLQSEIPRTQSHLHWLGGGIMNPNAVIKQCKMAGLSELFLKCPSTNSPAAFKLCDGFFVCWAFVGVAVLLFSLIPEVV